MIEQFKSWFDDTDTRITNWMAHYGVILLRVSVGVVFFWFGVLKFFPDLSPAEDLAAQTIETLTLGIVQPGLSLPVLAAWEVLIGIGLITGRFMRLTILLLFAQMLGTITPLFIFPEQTWTAFPYAPTLEGQYIIKNMVLVTAGIVIGATVRGGNMVADPDIAEPARQEARESLRRRPSNSGETAPTRGE